MDKRDQRVRRDRRRDGRRNAYQNEQGKETVKQKDSSVEEKKNDVQNEVSNKKNASEDKEKAIEDDPLRFANLKRETDEIAALKAKKPLKRQVFSNWSKYEEPLPSLDESRAADFETLLHAPQSGGFRFKSEQQWDTGSYGRFGELFTPDAELLVGGLSSLPFYLRLGIDKTLFLEDELQRMDTCAKENHVAYEKLSKSKPKRKVAASDLFKIDQAEKYSVVDQINGPTVELGTSTSKPVFSVEEAPEATPAEPPLPARAAGSSAEPIVRSRESTPATEGAAPGLHFEKPPMSFAAAKNVRSETPSRESTPLQEGSQGSASPEFHFERAPPPSYASGNVKSPFHSRESTPAKENVPTTVSRGSGGSRAPVSLGGSGRQVVSREGTPDPAARPVRDREAKQNVRDDRPTVRGVTSTTGVPSDNASLREAMPARQHEDDSDLRENSPVRKVENDLSRAVPAASLEVKQSLDKIPPKVETPGREEIQREPAPQRNSACSQDEPTHQKAPYDSDIVSEQKPDENGQIDTESDSYSKKRGKPDVRKQEGQQRGGGRHGRRKKGQNASSRGGDQSHTEAEDVRGDTAEPEAEVKARTAPQNVAPEETGREAPHRADGAKKKPERPPPPAVMRQQKSPSPTPQPSSAPAVVQQTQNEVPQPVASKPEEPKAQQVSKPVTPESQAQPPQRKTEVATKVDPVPKGRSSAGRSDDDGLNFLMSLRGQKTGGVSEVEVAKSAAGAAVSRSAIEEDEMKESQKPKPPPVITTEKKEDLEDWLDSMLDD